MNELDRATIYTRWLEFSLNLADAMDITPGRRAKLKDEIQMFIWEYQCPKDHDGSGEHLFPCAMKPILGWDASVEGDLCIGSHAEEYFEEYETHRKSGDIKIGSFQNQIFLCIRAGVDVVVPDMNGGGVWGFTIGNIRKAYKNNIPQWLNEVLNLKGDEPEDEPVWL